MKRSRALDLTVGDLFIRAGWLEETGALATTPPGEEIGQIEPVRSAYQDLTESINAAMDQDQSFEERRARFEESVRQFQEMQKHFKHRRQT